MAANEEEKAHREASEQDEQQKAQGEQEKAQGEQEAPPQEEAQHTDNRDNSANDEEQPEKEHEEKEKQEGESKSADERVKELEKQLEELNEKHLRLFSEFDNFKKRTKKEKSELIKSAGEDVIGELLPVLDDFERAILSNKEIESDNEQIDQLKDGFELIYNKLKKTLEDKGLQEMEAEGEEFNTDRHEAMTRMPVEEKEKKGKVVEVVQKGYYLNEKVLRYAKVVVGQ